MAERSSMVEREATVRAEDRLHARPAAQFVKTAKQFSSRITVTKGEREANVKSPLNVMSLRAKKGEKVLLQAEGDAAEKAIETLVGMISANEH